QNVLQKLENRSKHLIYISSTGVYGNFDGQWVTETSETNPQRPGGQACLEAETLIQNSEIASRSTILRLAGIYGKNRIPHWSAIQNQQWSKLSPHGHVNLIHVRDAARVVDSVLTQNLSGQLFLVSDGAPPKRVDFYNYIAEQSGTGPIDWTVPAEDKSTQRSSSDKRVSNRKLITMTQYEFLFPDFRSGIADALGTI
ncbi:MAG: NAD-dependent epimerase/dehydratase family protein, partial [Planctomycetota bacterium]